MAGFITGGLFMNIISFTASDLKHKDEMIEA